MKCKKILSSLLVIAMVMCLLPIKMFWAESNPVTLSINPDTESAYQGEEITCTVKMGKVQNLAGMKFKLNMPEGLTFVEGSGQVTEGLQTTLNAAKAEFTESTKVFVIGSSNYSSDAEIQLMTFKCFVDQGENITGGDKEITFIIDGDDIINTSYENISYNTTGASVNVIIPATEVSLDQTSIVLEKGDTRQLTAALTPSNSTDGVSWSSNSEGIATVTADGEKACTVAGVDLGFARITVTTTSGKEATCTVKVYCGHDNYGYRYEYVDETNHKKICVNCGTDELEEHTPKENGKENETPATCVTGGGYDQKYICSFCGCDLQSEHYESLPLGHDYQWTTEREATDDSLGIRKEVCTRCGDERNTEQYLKDGTCPSKDTDGNYISDNKDIPNSSATSSAKVDGQDKELEIIVQDPFGVLGVFELGIKSISDLDDDYDGNIPIEKALMADVNIYQFMGSTSTPYVETVRGSADMSTAIDSFIQSDIDVSDGKKHIFGDETEDDKYMVIYKEDEEENPRYYFYEKKSSGDLDGKVRLLMEIPDDPYDPNDDWDDYELEIQRLNEGADTTDYIEAIELRLYDADGNFVKVVEPGYVPKEGETVKKFLVTWTDHFSKYAMIDPEDPVNQTADADTTSTSSTTDGLDQGKTSGKGGLRTGENLNDIYFAGLLLSAAILAIYLSLKKRKEA